MSVLVPRETVRVKSLTSSYTVKLFHIMFHAFNSKLIVCFNLGSELPIR